MGTENRRRENTDVASFHDAIACPDCFLCVSFYTIILLVSNHCICFRLCSGFLMGAHGVLGNEPGDIDYSLHEAWNEATNVYLLVILVSFGLLIYAKK